MLYWPLNKERAEIRVIRLRGRLGDDDETLLCSLETRSLRDRFQYEALSYAWGDEEPSVSLRLGTHYILVTPNLFEALKCTRYYFRDVLIWVDAICIDQRNIKERNHQVILMRTIFKRAEAVTIWLGPAVDGCESLSDCIKSCSQANSLEPLLDPDTVDIPVSTRICTLMHILQAPWWQRVWVLQEAFLANRALAFCGNRFMSLHDLLQVNYWFIRLWQETAVAKLRDNIGSEMMETFGQAIFRWPRVLCTLFRQHEPNKREPTTRILALASECLTSDPRDKIYGTLGLWPRPILQPDYALSVTQVYANAAQAIMLDSRSFAIWTQCQLQEDSETPSWAVDWRFPPKSFEWLGMYDLYDATPGTCTSFEWRGSRLKARINIVDLVDAVGMNAGIPVVHDADDALERATSCFKNWSRLAGMRQITLEELQDDILQVERLNLSDRAPSGLPAAFPQSHEELDIIVRSLDTAPTWHEACLELGSCETFERTICMDVLDDDGYRRCTPGDAQTIHDAWSDLINSKPRTKASYGIERRLYDRRLFRTKSVGLFGIAKDAVAPGDLLVLVAGCKWPCLLRATTPPLPGRQCVEYKLVCMCYVHPIMDGQIMAEEGRPRFGGWEDVYIV